MTPGRAYLALVVAFCLTWSSAFPAAKLAMQVSPPLLFLGMRFLIAAGLLLGWAACTGRLRGPVPWLSLAWLGVLNQAGYQGFAWLGMSSASAGVATIIASLSPILVAGIAAPLLGERLHIRKVTGLCLGIAGAAYVVRSRVEIGEDLGGILLLVAALAALTAGTLAFKWAAPGAHLAVAVGVQQLSSGALLLTAGLLTEDPAAMRFDMQFGVTMAWFVVVVSIGAMMLWFLLLRRGSASSASALHFIMPPLGLVMSWFALGEPLRVSDLAGVLPIAAGIWLVTRAPPERSPA